jgi:acyl carrier protein
VDIRSLVERTFSSVTNVKTIDPGVGLTDQGLDSMGATQFVATLQEQLGIEVDTDLLFDFPLVDQLIAVLEKKRSDSNGSAEQAVQDRESLTSTAHR